MAQGGFEQEFRIKRIVFRTRAGSGWYPRSPMAEQGTGVPLLHPGNEFGGDGRKEEAPRDGARDALASESSLRAVVSAEYCEPGDSES